ncbi:MAG: redoxin family protein [Deltaproteobacteria bacterium]|nr:redoxin family protein [Deltaproteobacteria bacterium]
MPEPVKVSAYLTEDDPRMATWGELLERVASDVGVGLERVDITADAILMQRYGRRTPVVCMDGEEVVSGAPALSEPVLRKKLAKALDRRGRRSEGDHEEAELFRVETFIPPPAAVFAMVVAVVVAVGYFVFRGFEDAKTGRERLAATLFDVKARDEAPVPFRLRTIDGHDVGLDDFKDRIVIINFWATWCPPCIEEMPSMTRFAEKLKDDPRVVFLAISADDSWDPVKSMLGASSTPFRVLLDQGGKLANAYGTTKFPETYVVVDGRVRGYIIGPRDWDRWYAEAYIREVVGHSVGPAT